MKRRTVIVRLGIPRPDPRLRAPERKHVPVIMMRAECVARIIYKHKILVKRQATLKLVSKSQDGTKIWPSLNLTNQTAGIIFVLVIDSVNQSWHFNNCSETLPPTGFHSLQRAFTQRRVRRTLISLSAFCRDHIPLFPVFLYHSKLLLLGLEKLSITGSEVDTGMLIRSW